MQKPKNRILHNANKMCFNYRKVLSWFRLLTHPALSQSLERIVKQITILKFAADSKWKWELPCVNQSLYHTQCPKGWGEKKMCGTNVFQKLNLIWKSIREILGKHRIQPLSASIGLGLVYRNMEVNDRIQQSFMFSIFIKKHVQAIL